MRSTNVYENIAIAIAVIFVVRVLIVLAVVIFVSFDKVSRFKRALEVFQDGTKVKSFAFATTKRFVCHSFSENDQAIFLRYFGQDQKNINNLLEAMRGIIRVLDSSHIDATHLKKRAGLSENASADQTYQFYVRKDIERFFKCVEHIGQLRHNPQMQEQAQIGINIFTSLDTLVRSKVWQV